MKISVLLPFEERMNSFSGGAVARWVYQVYKNLGNHEVNIFGIKSEDEFDYKIDTVALPIYVKWLVNIINIINMLPIISCSMKSRCSRKLINKIKVWELFFSRYALESDVIHIHNRPSYAFELRKRGYKGKIILHMHNSLNAYIKNHDVDKLNNDVDLILYCSKFLYRESIADFPLLNVSSDVIYNGVNINNVNDYKKVPGKFIHSGRLVEEKGAHLAIEIINNLLDKGEDVTLNVVGGVKFGSNDKNEYVDYLVNLANDVNSKHGGCYVNLLGYLEHEELLKEMSTSSYFLYPCLWDEPFGMVIIEALSVSTPVFASKKGGIPEIVSGEVGVLVDDVDVQSFVNSYLEVKNHKYDNELVYSYVCDRFSWKKITSDMLDILNINEGYKCTF